MACFNKNSLSFSPAKTVKVVENELTDDHTEYVIKIRVGNYEWKICRRYSEFIKLNSTFPPELRDLAKHLLPKKQIFGSNSESVVKERQNKLEIYLQCLFRSLTVIPYSLLQFLKFDVYEIHGVTETLAGELYNDGDKILSKGKTYTLTTLQMHAVCKRLELPEPTSSGDPTRDVGHVLDVINRLKSLKVTGNFEKLGMSNIVPNDLSFHFHHFKSLQSIHFENCDMKRVRIDDRFRKSIKMLKVSHSLTDVGEIMMAGLEWKDCSEFSRRAIDEYSWTSLEFANFSNNKIVNIDSSVRLVSRLEQVILSHNGLEKLEGVEHLQSLKFLDVSHNRLTESSLSNLTSTNINSLNVSHNNLKSFAALLRLPTLSYLDASFNNIEKVEEVSCVGRLNFLKHLILKGNPIAEKSEYRVLVFQMFGNYFTEVTLDYEKASEIENDMVLVRQALQMAGAASASGGSKASHLKTTSISIHATPTSLSPALYQSDSCPSFATTTIPPITFPLTAGSITTTAATLTTKSSSLKVVTKTEEPNLSSLELKDSSELVAQGIRSRTSGERPVLLSQTELPVELVTNLKHPSSPIVDRNEFVASLIEEEEMACGGGERERVVVATVGEVIGGIPIPLRVQDDGSSNEKQNQEEVSGTHHLHFPFFFGHHLMLDSNARRSSSTKQVKRKKYFLLPETLPNQNNRAFLSLLEDMMDPPDSFGLPEIEYRQNNAGHITWCTALTNLRKSQSHGRERPMCVCVTPLKIHLFRVDQLRGDAGIPKMRYFTFVLISDIECFMIGYKFLYLRIVDRFQPSKVIVLLMFNSIKVENFLHHVKKASRRNIPFLDDYEDPVIHNSSKACEFHLFKYLASREPVAKNLTSDKKEIADESESMKSLEINFYQLAQLVPEGDSPLYLRTSAIIFTDKYIYVLFQDFSNFPPLPDHALNLVFPRQVHHRVAAVFPLTCNLFHIKQYDGDSIDKLDKNPEGPEFIGYGLKLYFSLHPQQSQVLDLRWPTSFMRREFITYLHKAFDNRRTLPLLGLHLHTSDTSKEDDKLFKKSSSDDASGTTFHHAGDQHDKTQPANLSCSQKTISTIVDEVDIFTPQDLNPSLPPTSLTSVETKVFPGEMIRVEYEHHHVCSS